MRKHSSRRISRPWALATVASVSFLCPIPVCAQGGGVRNTKHNLSSSGPGLFKSTIEEQVCIFCHTPHDAAKRTQLWNREDSTAIFVTYKSSTFKGSVAQPNGSTTLCLSCHDGTIALGRVHSRGTEIPMAAGRRLLDSGRSHIGTNLQDDHPVSFHYASSRGGSGIDYRLASGLPPQIPLDDNGMMQCTTCHDAHDNTLGKFVRMNTRNGELCLACHQPRNWVEGAHATSSARAPGAGGGSLPGAPYATVKENACQSCHVVHAAGQPARLLRFPNEEENCLGCHSGSVAAKNIDTDLRKMYAHDVRSFNDRHDPVEDPKTMSRHVECQDCHNPHTAKSGVAPPPQVPGPLFGVSGIDGSDQFMERITYGYQLCYKCHSSKNGGSAEIPRVIHQTDVALEFDAANPSYHPIEAPGKNSNVPSLLAGWTESSIMTCTSCHQSDSSPDFGGSGARGPHGSSYSKLLGARYDRGDPVDESSDAYALCYKCHSRTSILNDNSFKDHKKHIVEERSSCSVCHDPHGISHTQGNATNHSHLINFDTRFVFKSRKNLSYPVPTFVDLGSQRGKCYLECHGKDHEPKDY